MPRPNVEILSESPGDGDLASRGSDVTIRYTGELHRGDVFQRDVVTTFRLGGRRVIAGLEYGVEGMRVGGTRVIRVPPHLAYRADGVPGVIPPNALLVFRIELLAVGSGVPPGLDSASP